MAKEKPTLFRLSKQLDNARRHYAAGNIDAALTLMGKFKDGAREVHEDQQENMVRDMNHHLQLRQQLKDLTVQAKELAAEVKSRGDEGGGTDEAPE